MLQNWETLYNDKVSATFDDEDFGGDCADNKKSYNLAQFYPQGNFLTVPQMRGFLAI